ncbi:MAG TPA: hypothetical protein VMB73_22220 [Acetobacteraceae bacterium]|jgi:hypothetical protein|nr:hypothetical protein [Acetobacteraceae bacterium]
MRLLPLLLVLPLFLGQAHAQSAPAPSAPTVAAPAAAAQTAPPAGQTKASLKQHRMTWQQRFATANTTHDGHLTPQQAKAGYLTISRHFNEIDADKKGYVTVADVANWHKQQSAMHHARQGQASQPGAAMQQGGVQTHQVSTSTATK